MPKLRLTRKDNGQYETAGLNERQFLQATKQIHAAQTKKRRNAKRTLAPHQMRSKKDLAKLGKRGDGLPFTDEDLKSFVESRKKHAGKYDSSRDGISYGEIVRGSREIDIKRANNQVSDGSGITRAALVGIQANMLTIRVKASEKNGADTHSVRLRLEQWDEYLHSEESYKKSIKKVAQGRISIDCTCGRHQYWYRYLATAGRYCVAPPKEHAFPKIKNPEMTGVACKHVLKAVAMLQGSAWHGVLVGQMKAQAKRISFGDDKKYTHVVKGSEAKKANRNRATKVNVDKAEQAYNRYVKDQAKFAKALKKHGAVINKKRKESSLRDRRVGELEDKVKSTSKAARKASQQADKMRDMIRNGFNIKYDGYKMQGKTKAQAIADYATELGTSQNQVKEMIKR
ncbi:hypothetical protein [Thaumasiovibrio sp. DFM-14]|uniref:hypothetical protein n=1 Tax=Thaumasiovibrio sp. DFM-14 TaxID=3384792 RepID=UPI0039A2612F